MKENCKFTIKEFSEITNVSSDALRYYDKIGLFHPSSRNADTGYRYYTMNDFEAIGVIQTLQSLGMSLEGIKSYIDNKTFFGSYQILKEQLKSIECRIDELSKTKSYLESRIAFLDSIMDSRDIGSIRLRKIGRRTGFWSEKRCTSYADIQSESARIVGQYTRELFISHSYALYIPMDELQSGEYADSFYTAVLDVAADREDFNEFVLEDGTYLCSRYSGTSFERTPAVEAMLKYISNNSLEICGDAVQLCIIDENLTNIDSEKLNELQIPVRTR